VAAAESVVDSEAPDAALAAAVSIELLHTYTLVHDDLPCMDDDDLRRGQPTVHVAYDEGLAVLVGDALQTLAFEALGQAVPGSRYPPGQLVLELSQAAGSRGVIAGQVEDIAASNAALSEDELTFVHEHKTAILFRAALRMGAIAANADDEQLEALSAYGLALGMAFQITDDLLDAGQDAGGDGESTDRALTCLAVYDLDTAKQKARDQIHIAISSVQSLEARGRLTLEAIVTSLADRSE
jgi:geranylgeranyl pyrophosphate synthase